MISLVEPVIRPPSEADSLLLQATLGCSHNKCAFCGTYLAKKFRVRPLDEVLAEIDGAAEEFESVRRAFLCDGNALCLDTNHLAAILDRINLRFPKIQRIGTYANAADVLAKSPEELRALREKKLSIIYLGLESGSDEVLRRVKKGNTAAQAVEAVQRAQAAGMKASVMTLLGLGGKELTKEHAADSAKILNAMNPRYISFLTVVVLPGTALDRDAREGKFAPLEPIEVVEELRAIVAGLNVANSILRSNHVSNLVALAGNLPRDKERMLREIDAALADPRLLRPRPFPYLL
jgi:radical SAM superfamily enzyme YgiQ (UPF0313 family)